MLSGQLPYNYLKSDGQVLLELHNGIQPRRPDDPCIADNHWHFIQQCWLTNERDRPQIAEVCQFLEEQYQKDHEK